MDSFLLSPLVIAHRLPQLVYEAFHPNPFAREESYRAVTEKMEAMGEGLMAAQVEAMTAPYRIAIALLSGRNPALTMLGTPHQVARAAVEPINRRVRANVRRLSDARISRA